MEAYTSIFVLVVAGILVAVKLILEHQRDQDRLNGNEQDPSFYTFRGMLRLMREDRKADKLERKQARRDARLRAYSERHNASQSASNNAKLRVPIKRFENQDKNQEGA